MKTMDDDRYFLTSTSPTLLSLYAPLLTSKQRQILFDYFLYDLSLQEIATTLNISRQAVLDFVQKGIEKIKDFDNILHYFPLLSFLEKNKATSLLSSEAYDKILEIILGDETNGI
jgi:predicted DNA-binding protein YlxM (UPF0122 family)